VAQLELAHHDITLSEFGVNEGRTDDFEEEEIASPSNLSRGGRRVQAATAPQDDEFTVTATLAAP
jgi:hypothetical protein